MINIIACVVIFLFRQKTAINATIKESISYHFANKSMNNVMDNVENILLNNNDEKYKNNLVNDTKKHSTNYKNIIGINNNTNLFANSITILLFGIVVYILFKKLKISTNQKPISGTQITSVILIMTFFIDAIFKVIERINYNVFQFGKISDSTKYFDIDDVKPSRSNFQAIDPNNTSINIQNLSIKRGNKLVFKNFNLSIPHRHKLAIFGKSGRGKSTLMKAIMGIVHPIDGSIQVSGHDLKTHDLVDLRSKIVFIGQDTVLLNKNIVDNMMEGNFCHQGGSY